MKGSKSPVRDGSIFLLKGHYKDGFREEESVEFLIDGDGYWVYVTRWPSHDRQIEYEPVLYETKKARELWKELLKEGYVQA